jgi:hypothetical protein
MTPSSSAFLFCRNEILVLCDVKMTIPNAKEIPRVRRNGLINGLHLYHDLMFNAVAEKTHRNFSPRSFDF